MKALAALLILQFAGRLFEQSLGSALASTVFLSIFAAIAYRWGDWRSVGQSLRWLRARPTEAWLVSAGTVGCLGLMIYSGTFHPASMLAETISAYFVFYAFCAVGDRLLRRLRVR